MTDSTSDVPVHGSLIVTGTETIYRTDAWWKAVVAYRYEGSESDETAVYLWHHDDEGWTRKNKYVIRTVDAWETDKQIIDTLLAKETGDDDVSEEFPVSDHYIAGAGVTVFKSDGWWKGILNIVKKGTYETNEVMVYLWQNHSGGWKRRQKYTIGGCEDWEKEQTAIESVLNANHESSDDSAKAAVLTGQDENSWDDLDTMDTDALIGLDEDVDDHLGEALY
jgi:hypothetical protein